MEIKDKLAYTIPEAVEASGRSRTSIYASIKNGTLVARKHGGRTIILTGDLHRWLEALPKLTTNKAA